MTKRTKPKVEVEPVGKKVKNNNVNKNKNHCFAVPHKIDDFEFVTSCISNTLKDDDKKGMKKIKSLNCKGDHKF